MNRLAACYANRKVECVVDAIDSSVIEYREKSGARLLDMGPDDLALAENWIGLHRRRKSDR